MTPKKLHHSWYITGRDVIPESILCFSAEYVRLSVDGRGRARADCLLGSRSWMDVAVLLWWITHTMFADLKDNFQSK